MTLFDRVVTLADCLCVEVTAAGTPEVCFCGIVPGDAAAADYMGGCGTKNGMAWVRVKNIYPASSVGAANIEIGNCSTQIGMDVELGIMRTIVVGDARGNPPSPAQLREAASLQLLDAETMLRAIRCCDGFSSKDYVIGQYEPLGPEGGVVGGIWTISVI